MRQNIYITQSTETRKKASKKPLFRLPLLLFLILLPIALWITEGSNFTTALYFLFSKKDIVVYDTYTLSFDTSISQEYRDSIVENLDKLDFNGKKRFKIKEKGGDIELSREKGKDSKQVSGKDLIPVGHVYSLLNEINEESLSTYSVYVLQSSYKEYLNDEYNLNVSILSSYDDLVKKLFENDNNIGLIDFTDLDSRVKILSVSGKYYLEDTTASIPIRFYASLSSKVDDFVLSVLSKNMDINNSYWNKERLVKVNMGGVVAISRGLAMKIDSSGDNAYPAKEIGSFLTDADLTHVSNEVSFVPNCRSYSGMLFCSRPEYIEVLQKSGIDIVELTGNHNNDYGAQYNKESIEMYKSLGMRYFGGGLNDEDASKILYEEISNTKIAFVGYNYYDTMYRSLALAGEDRAGANSYSKEKLKRDIQEAKKNADIVIVTFQFQECYSYPASDVIYPICYKPLSNPDQQAVFKEAIDIGANIVVGTQAHQPQTYELYGNGIIFYGLGNLYFDQSMWIGTRQGLILSHYFYEGKHIQTKIVPIYMDRDLIPRLATQEQGDLLMELLKEARE